MSEVPVALRARRAVQPDLWPLDRPPPPQVDDPGPRTLLRDGGDTDEVIAAARTAIATAPRRWAGAASDVEADRWRAAGAAVAELASAAVPGRVQVDPAGAVHLPELELTVTPDGQVTAGVGGSGPTARQVDARLLQVPAAERVLHAVALAVAEDLVLIDAEGRVVWLHVTAPSGWDPGASVGVALVALHGPIPDAQRLRAASRALARAVTDGGPFVRWTWGVTATPSLPSGPDTAAISLPEDVGSWTFRAERQTTAPLPAAQLGLFTIRVHRAPLREVISTPRRARDLADTVAAMSPRMAAYKGLAEDRPRLERWLAARR